LSGANCAQGALARCFVYLLPWQVSFWSYARSILDAPSDLPGCIQLPTATDPHDPSPPAACAPDEPALDGGAELRPSLSARVCSTLQTALSSPLMLSIPVAVFVGLCTALFEDPGPMLPIGSAARTIADSLLAIATLIMASSFISLSGSLGGETLPRKSLAPSSAMTVDQVIRRLSLAVRDRSSADCLTAEEREVSLHCLTSVEWMPVH
jgi:hypothetical protein